MPDNLPDELGVKEMGRAYDLASTSSGEGAIWFSWDGAVEKDKTTVIKKVFEK